jgi:hypothetical protein
MRCAVRAALRAPREPAQHIDDARIGKRADQREEIAPACRLSASHRLAPVLERRSAASACGRKVRPASVSRALPRMRSNIGAPSSCSSMPRRRLIAGCVRCNRRPALVKPPSSAMATKVSISSIFIDQES